MLKVFTRFVITNCNQHVSLWYQYTSRFKTSRFNFKDTSCIWLTFAPVQFLILLVLSNVHDECITWILHSYLIYSDINAVAHLRHAAMDMSADESYQLPTKGNDTCLCAAKNVITSLQRKPVFFVIGSLKILRKS